MKMLKLIYVFMIIFALSLATDVRVYNSYEAYYRGSRPVFESVFPWKFSFNSGDWFYIATGYLNKSPAATAIVVTVGPDLVTGDWNNQILSKGENVEVVFGQLSGPELIINVNLYTSNGLCNIIRFAEGKVDSEKSEKEYKYTDICMKGITEPCVFLVDLKDVICNGTSVVTQINEDLKTTTPLTGLENNNTTFVSNSSLSTHENMKTLTNCSENNTNVKITDNTVIIIVGSLSGITLILLAIIAIWKRCWMNRSPQGTSDLPTNQNNQPFYVNSLFRRECDEQIAEIDQHHYEEITPQVSTEGG